MANSKRKCACGCERRERRELMLITPNNSAFIDADHAASYAKSRGAKLRKRAEKVENQEFKQRKREFKENDHRHQFKLTLESAKKLCRILDAGKPCISCGTTADVQYAAGHFKSAGAHPELALDLRNIHRQCNRNCNCGLSGNIAGTRTTPGYRKGLELSYGSELVSWLESYRPPRKYTCDELIAMRKEFNAEIRRLEKGLPPSKDWRSIQSQEARLAGRGEQEKAA